MFVCMCYGQVASQIDEAVTNALAEQSRTLEAQQLQHEMALQRVQRDAASQLQRAKQELAARDTQVFSFSLFCKCSEKKLI